MKSKKSMLILAFALVLTVVAFSPRPALANLPNPWTWPGPWVGQGTGNWAGSWTENKPQAGPWTLQPWCLEHEGCVQYHIRNRTDAWVQIYLTRGDTIESGFFTVRPGANGAITLIPWLYQAHYVYWCNGNMKVYTTLWPVGGNQVDTVRCPRGVIRGKR
jgi:hypothetical protein